MSDVTVTVVESNTNVTVTEQDVAVAITETPVTVTTSTAGIQGATGATGAGYSGVTSTSTITIGSGLKTFTLVSGNQGAFVTGMRIRAIHSDTPTYYMEGTANYVGAGTLIITVDKFNGSGSHNLWQFAISGEVGQTGATGSSGVVSVTSPITNTGTSGSAIVGIDQTLLSLTRSQISDFTSGTVTSISGTVTQSQVTSLTTDLAGKASLGAANAFTVGGHVITNAATAVVPLTITGVASQSADLLQLKNSTPTNLFAISAAGLITAKVVGNAANQNRGLLLSNTVDTWQSGLYLKSDGSGNPRIALLAPTGALGEAVSIDAAAKVGIGSTAPTAQLDVYSGAAARIGQVVRGAASQSANLQEWQTSAGGTVSAVDASGNANMLRVNTRGAVYGTGAYFGTVNVSQEPSGNGIVVVGRASETSDLLQIRTGSSSTSNFISLRNSGGTELLSISSTGAITTSAGVRTVGIQGTGDGLTAITTTTGRNLQLAGNTASSGGGAGVVGITNATTVPTSNPTGGGILYVEAGALKYRGSSGTITTLGAA